MMNCTHEGYRDGIIVCSGQSAEPCAGQVGETGPREADQGDEVPRLLLDLSRLASKG